MKAKIQLLQADDINTPILMLDGKMYTLSAPEEILTHPDTVGVIMLIGGEHGIIGCSERENDINVPIIHKAFIEKYISEYNNGNKITDVWVVDDYTNPSKPFVGTNGCIVVKKYTPEKFTSEDDDQPVDEAPLSPKIQKSLDDALVTARVIMANSTYGAHPAPNSALQAAVDKILADKTLMNISSDIKKITITVDIETSDLEQEVIQTLDKLTKDLSWEEIVKIVRQIK